MKNKVDDIGKLGRWLDKISSFQFTIVHRAGISIPHADYLSREPGVAVHRFITTQPILSRSELLKRQSNLDWNHHRWKALEPTRQIGGIIHSIKDDAVVPIVDTPSVEELMEWHCLFGHMSAKRLLSRLRQVRCVAEDVQINTKHCAEM